MTRRTAGNPRNDSRESFVHYPLSLKANTAASLNAIKLTGITCSQGCVKHLKDPVADLKLRAYEPWKSAEDSLMEEFATLAGTH